jgi:hypothetical protein
LVTVTSPVFVTVLAGVVVNAGLGAESVSVAPVTLKRPVPVALPLGVVTVTFFSPRLAAGPMLHDAFTVVSVGAGVVIVHVMFPPPICTAVAPARPEPLIVTATVVFRAPDAGLTPVTVIGEFTVNGTLLLVSGAGPDVLTVTLCAPSAAPVPMVKVAVTVVSLVATTLLTVIPPPAFAVTTADKPVPVRVTLTAVPRTPEVGAIEVKTGVTGVPLPWYSTAPTSK